MGAPPAGRSSPGTTGACFAGRDQFTTAVAAPATLGTPPPPPPPPLLLTGRSSPGMWRGDGGPHRSLGARFGVKLALWPFAVADSAPRCSFFLIFTVPSFTGVDTVSAVDSLRDLESGVSKPVLNLKGYLVGNPATGERIDLESRVPYAHGHGMISDQLYETIMEHCHGEDYSKPKNVICAQALDRSSKLLDECRDGQILDKKCAHISSRAKDGTANRKSLKEEPEALSRIPPRPPMDCWTYKNYLSYFWANNNITRVALGIKKGSKDEWLRCHDGDLPYSQDINSSIKYHRNVTLKGYRVLVYSGDQDAMVPFIGTQAWVRSLNFPIAVDWRAWHLDGQSAGFTIAYSNNLTFTTIKGGSHTAPEDEPERCFAMFSRWISNEQL